MRQYEKEKPLISIHVPKCAGSSFFELLKKWFDGNCYKHYFNENSNKMPPKHVLRLGICIHGHFNKKRKFGVIAYYPEVDQFITILRDPFEIAISDYFYVKKKGEDSSRNGRKFKYKKNINEHIRDKKPFMLLHMPYEMTLENYKEILDKYFIYIGIVDDLQTSVNVLARKLGFPPVEIEHSNISERDEEVLKEVREEYKNKYPLEYAIYNYALEHYKR